MAPFPHVYCRVLGPARVTVDGADAPPELLWRKHLALLVYLARSPRRSRTREHLVGLLWSDRDERQARHSLSEALRLFRRILGDEQVHADVDQIRLGADAVTLDCDRFVESCGRGDWQAAAASRGRRPGGRAGPCADGAPSSGSWQPRGSGPRAGGGR